MTSSLQTLADYGWTNFFQSQLSIEETETMTPRRVTEVHRNEFETVGMAGPARLHLSGKLAEHGLAVGDWVLVENGTEHATRVLERKSLLQRRAAGDQPVSQLIAANIDTLFIVSSCNDDYNTARIERYVALARQAGVDPVLILTKADMCEDADSFRQKAEQEIKDLLVETVDAKSPDTIVQLAPWCAKGQTLALIGSSGVGKTTLMNLLAGRNEKTLDTRQDDAKGRHTTTARSMYPMPTGSWMIDTPGMRALRLFDVSEGVEIVFQDIADLAQNCRFSNCAHETEPGCAIMAAIEADELDAARLKRWQKLQLEDLRNSATMAQSHARARRVERTYDGGRERGKAKRGPFK
ncbi:MAG: ribosome small subunit-dependent GTPase A [Marinosulfonomonas sp.]|nr:ribosome small subunit-dependent GTPase A [Marinosulfonomonas sp.]